MPHDIRKGDVFADPDSRDLNIRNRLLVVVQTDTTDTVKAQPYHRAAWDSWFSPSDLGRRIARIEREPRPIDAAELLEDLRGMRNRLLDVSRSTSPREDLDPRIAHVLETSQELVERLENAIDDAPNDHRLGEALASRRER